MGNEKESRGKERRNMVGKEEGKDEMRKKWRRWVKYMGTWRKKEEEKEEKIARIEEKKKKEKLERNGEGEREW